MRSIFLGGVCAAMTAFSITAFAQAGQPAGQPQSTAGADQQVTITGCIQREADFRRSQDAGRGGVAGTGVGIGNEFVLANASMSGAAGAAPAPTGTAGGSAAAGTAYELTGPNEGTVGQYVGKRVEIVGKLKPAEVGAAGPTGGPTAGAPPRGVDVTSQDLKLRELEITSVREASGTCAAAR